MGVGKILTGIARMVPDIIAMKKHCESLTQIKVKAEAGCAVTAVCGGLVIHENESGGYCYINVPIYGKWTLKGRVGAEATNTEVVNVIEPTQYFVELATLQASLNVAAPTGAVVTLTGASTQTAESIGGFATFAIPSRGTYSVSADYKGCKSSTKQIEITGDGTKSVTLDFITLDVTAPVGSTVVVTQGVDRYPVAITSEGPVKVYLPRTGDWDVLVTCENLENAKLGTVNFAGYEAKTFSVTGAVNVLTVNTPPGAQLSVTDEVTGDIVDGLAYTKFGVTGVTTFYLPCIKKVPGYKWRLMLYKGGQSGEVAQQVVEFSAPGEAKEISMSFAKTYGIRLNMLNENSETGITYIDAAKNHATGWDAWKHEELFKNIKPCYLSKNGKVSFYLQRDDYTKKEDGSTFIYTGVDPADVMVEFPKMGYQITKPDANTVEIRLTTGDNVPGFCYLPFSRDTEGDCDKIYIGAYQAWIGLDNKLYSPPGERPTSRNSINSLRKAAALKGAGYQQLDFFTLTLLQCLFLLVFKNGDSHFALVGPETFEANNNEEKYWKPNGELDKKPFCYAHYELKEAFNIDGKGAWNEGAYWIKFLGLESFTGGYDLAVDGCYFDWLSRSVKTTYKGFNDTGNGYLFANRVGEDTAQYGTLWIGDIFGKNEAGFMPTKHGDSPINGGTNYRSGTGQLELSHMEDLFLFAFEYIGPEVVDNLCGRLVYKHLAV